MPHTPITDQVRERKDDYLAAVEELELSHADLLAAIQVMVLTPGILAHLAATDPMALEQARAAIAKAQQS